MDFNDAAQVESLCYQLRLSDWPRSTNRALINSLFNGSPPYSPQEVSENRVTVNVNDLTSTRLSHDARSQMYSAFLKPGNYFQCRTDYGKAESRQRYNTIVTKEMNKMMKRSLDYFECFRSKFASLVLHGIGPAGWRDRDEWCPEPKGVEDIMIPANTLLTMRNLPFFAIYHSFTAPELIKLTRGPKVDPGWNMPLVDACIEWIDQETRQLMGQNWPAVWSPEKSQERVKGDGGWFVGDQVPTIDTWDFYFWNDDGKKSGWNRRMILDSWSTPSPAGISSHLNKQPKLTRKKGVYDDNKLNGQFLFNPKDRQFADDRSEIIGFQFADLSAVAPFRYHSVRSLGFLLYAICHLQMRLRCKFNESIFEALMMYFRVKSQDEAERLLKVDLINRGFLDDSMQFVPASDRFQVNAGLVELGLRDNQQLISDNSSSYVQNQNMSRDKVEKTKFQVMAEVNAMTSLISAGLTQAYAYQTFEYREIFRRFSKEGSKNVDVQKYQAACLRQRVPEKVLYCPESWEQEPERVMGAGNKTLEMAIAEQLLQMRPLYDPEPQRQILRDITLAITDDPARADSLVPPQPTISDSIHDAQLAAGTLMQGLPVAIKSGVNEVEYIQTMLTDMAMLVKKYEPTGMAPPNVVEGLSNMAQHTGQHIQILSANKAEQQHTREFGDALGQINNYIKGFQQRLMEMQKKAAEQNGGGGVDPKDQAKIQATMLTAQTKNQITQQSHAQRTAQRQVQFEQQLKQEQEKHAVQLQKERVQTAADVEAKDLQTEAEIEAQRKKSKANED